MASQTRHIDLNADLGEGMSDDAALMPLISSCNIACGGHAGDQQSMLSTLQLAKQHNIVAGAHPSYPDKKGFGREPVTISKPELENSLRRQLLDLRGLSKVENYPLRHVKPHGALYNHAADDIELARLLVDLIDDTLPNCAVVGLPESAISLAAKSANMPFIAEGFADRAYTAEGRLVPRREENAVISNSENQKRQALALARHTSFSSQTGTALTLKVDTICIHGDTPGALQSAQTIKQALEAAGLKIKATR
jgi:UPF0271 protein